VGARRNAAEGRRRTRAARVTRVTAPQRRGPVIVTLGDAGGLCTPSGDGEPRGGRNDESLHTLFTPEVNACLSEFARRAGSPDDNAAAEAHDGAGGADGELSARADEEYRALDLQARRYLGTKPMAAESGRRLPPRGVCARIRSDRSKASDRGTVTAWR
jgi:hypothetical protein